MELEAAQEADRPMEREEILSELQAAKRQVLHALLCADQPPDCDSDLLLIGCTSTTTWWCSGDAG